MMYFERADKISYVNSIFDEISGKAGKLKVQVSFEDSGYPIDVKRKYPASTLARVDFLAKEEVKKVFVSHIFSLLFSETKNRSSLQVEALEKTKKELATSKEKIVKMARVEYDLGSSEVIDYKAKLIENGQFIAHIDDSHFSILEELIPNEISSQMEFEFKELLCLQSDFKRIFSSSYYLTTRRIDAVGCYQTYRIDSLKRIDLQRDIVQELSEIDPSIIHVLSSKISDISFINGLPSILRNEIKLILDHCFNNRRLECYETNLDYGSLYKYLMTNVLDGSFHPTEFYGMTFIENNGVAFPIEEAPIYVKSLMIMAFLTAFVLCEGDSVTIENPFVDIQEGSDKSDSLACFFSLLKDGGININSVGC